MHAPLTFYRGLNCQVQEETILTKSIYTATFPANTLLRGTDVQLH